MVGRHSTRIPPVYEEQEPPDGAILSGDEDGSPGTLRPPPKKRLSSVRAVEKILDDTLAKLQPTSRLELLKGRAAEDAQVDCRSLANV